MRLQKTMALVQASPSASIRARRTARFSVAWRSLRLARNITTACSMVSDAVACRATSTFAGFDRNVLVIRSISGAMVAEKNKVWRVKGVRPKMRSISGMKPMSSIRSASSTTMILTSDRISLPRSK